MQGTGCPPENQLRPDASVMAAVAVLESADSRIALVVEDDRRLLGTVTDGDVRRGLLGGVRLEDRVETVMNRQPLTAAPDAPGAAMVEAMRRRRVLYLPLLDEAGRLVGLESLHRLEALPSRRSNLVVIMAGGRGKRLMPLTDSQPKPMLEVGGKPILQIIIERFARNGFGRFVIALNYRGDAIEAYFGNGARFGVEIDYLREEAPLGTVGALSLLEEPPKEPFFVVNGDVLTRVDFELMLRFHLEERAEVTMGICEFDLEVPYGVVEVEGLSLVRMVEKPVYRHFVNAGLYVFDPAVLKQLRRGQPLDLPDLVNSLRDQERPVSVFPIHELWLDVGRRGDLERAHTVFAAE